MPPSPRAAHVPTTPQRPRYRRAAWAGIGIAVGALGFVLFPFDWLEAVWPGYARLFDRVFVTARDHAIGHTALFFIAGMLVLLALQRLRARPLVFLSLMGLGALAQEAVQALFKRHWPTIGDGRDLFFDLLGFSAAYLFLHLVRRLAVRPWRLRGV
ncbi:MAG: hypothetical protein IVW57_03580 [Ktedonobacterales bacterium]|nr:hypothetical protein [Ktedonobacterales bacterium]